MRIIGENIHIISAAVKEAIKNADAKFFQDLAAKQVEAGAWAIDLNVGPRKKDGEEFIPWLVQTVQEVIPREVPISLDTTNLAGIRAGLKVMKNPGIINSTSAEEERLQNVPLAAKEFDTMLIALTMGKSGIPVSADERVAIALETLIPRFMEVDFPMEKVIFDPLVLTVSGCQEYCPECIEAVRTLPFSSDPPPMVSVGLSNVSNAVPHGNRPLINHVYCAMLMGAGLEMMIADPLDEKLWEVINTIENQDASTPLRRLYLKIHDVVQDMEELQPADVDMSDPEQVAVWKTVQILLNKVIYADGYLEN
ncbi:MAG: dihydropteroate synthase [Anaerolineae bacterium]|nr:dihydropteroate synthase [Anaerolineae bacterium]